MLQVSAAGVKEKDEMSGLRSSCGGDGVGGISVSPSQLQVIPHWSLQQAKYCAVDKQKLVSNGASAVPKSSERTAFALH